MLLQRQGVQPMPDPFCWVIDPVKRTAWEYHAGMDPVRVTGALRAGELLVNVNELFAALD